MKKHKAKTKQELEKMLDNAWFGIDLTDDELFDPMSQICGASSDGFLTRFTYLMGDPDYFYFVCKYILNVEILPAQSVILKELWERKSPMLLASRGFSKSFSLALYCMLRMLLMPGRKLVIVGAAFRQSKVVFEYMESIWNNAPVLRDLCYGANSGPKKETDRFIMSLQGGYTLCLPLGTGQTIRGARAHDIIAEEFASIPIDIFENVVGGFAAVSASPIEKVKLAAKKALAIEYGIELVDVSDTYNKSNQIILCGTASYEWSHFCKYWKRYKGIIESKGDLEKLTQHLGYVPSKDFDWRDFSVIRIPVELAPPGLMDAGIIDRAKATVSSGIYMHEYGATFSRDSMGFFKRSLIDGCTLSLDNPISLPSGDIMFVPMNKGNSNGKYVIAVDPASEVDNFSIVVLEVFSDHRRVVYCWTTNRQKHRNLMKSGMTHEDDFYGYCARKIRDLMAVFPTVEVAIDGQGGGIAVIEALHDRTKLLEGEIQMWPKIIEGKEQSTDDFGGLHIIEVCQFGRYEWVSEANHGLRKDLEDKVLIFPFFDSATIGMAEMKDMDEGRIYDTNEDCIMEIEELKNELSMIIVTESPNGRARWDTPDGKSNNKKNKIRKDRYSALIMANMSARQIKFNVQPKYTGVRAGFAGRTTDKENGPLYVCPQWWEGAYK